MDVHPGVSLSVLGSAVLVPKKSQVMGLLEYVFSPSFINENHIAVFI